MTLATRDSRLKTTIGGKYRIVRFLAEGGMGAVYEAQHLVVKRRFAVKFLRADLARRRDVLTRFKREAEATGALEGENIAAAVDFGITADQAPYIVMEYLDGIDLGALLARTGPLPVERAADLALQACIGVQEAHAAGVVHRDLKPRNLFVCRRRDGSDLLKVVDFGIAKLLAFDPNSQVTRTGSLLGTPSYMSPEQARGETHVDALADVYALGVILYEMLAGCTPHRGDSFNAIIHNIATQPAMPLAAQGRAFPPELEALVARALSPDPAARPASAEQLAKELSPFARREVWPDSSDEPRAPSRGDGAPADDAELAANSRSLADFSRGPPEAGARPWRGRLRLASWSAPVVVAILGWLWFSGRALSLSGPAAGGNSPRQERTEATQTPDARKSVPDPAASATGRAEEPLRARVPPPSIPRRPAGPLAVGTGGRPGERSPMRPSTPPEVPKANVPADVTAAFDTKNPYE